MLKTYIISHHSQTAENVICFTLSLRPILFHIILKLCSEEEKSFIRLRPILFHIILKRNCY